MGPPGWWCDWLILLTRAGLGYGEALGLRWPEARALAAAADRAERGRLMSLACAARAAQAPEKAWRAWLDAVAAADQSP